MIKDFIEREKHNIQNNFDINKVCRILESNESIIKFLIKKNYITIKEAKGLYKYALTNRDYITYEMKEYFSDWQGNNIDNFIDKNFDSWIHKLSTCKNISKDNYDSSLIRHITVESTTYIYYKHHKIIRENSKIKESEKKEIIEILYEVYGYDYDYYEFQSESSDDEELN